MMYYYSVGRDREMIIIEDLSRLVSFTGLFGMFLVALLFGALHRKDRVALGIVMALVYIGTLIPRIF
jgi:hypothetical protein